MHRETVRDERPRPFRSQPVPGSRQGDPSHPAGRAWGSARPTRPDPLSRLGIAWGLATGLALGIVPTSAEDSMDIARLYEPGSVAVEERTPADTRRIVIPYRLMRPAAATPGVRHPLVVFLHGAGERGDDNLSQLKYLPAWLAEPALRQSHPCFVLAPQCRQDRRWAPFDWSDKRSSPLAEQPTPDLAGAIAALDRVLSEESIDPDRVLLTGLSMGGYGSWEWAMRSPERFAALVPICGGGDERKAERLVNVPVWCFHGAADTVVPVERSRTMIEAIRAAGGSPRYSELPGVGHDSWTPAYRQAELLTWLFSQRRGAAPDR